MALRLYIDEVGNSDLRGASEDPNVRYLALTGIIADREHHQSRISPALEQLKGVFPLAANGKRVILHRRDMMRREGPFSVLYDNDIRAKFDDDLAEFVKTQPYLVNTVQIDKKAHLDTYAVWHYEPYHYCLCCIVERYVLYLLRHEKQGDVVVEQRGKTPDKKLKESFARIYHHGTDNIGPDRIQRALLSRDIGFYSKNADIAGLQIADVLAHPAARYMRFKRAGMDQPDDYGARLADILVKWKFAPRTMTIDGWGTKWLP